MTQHDLFDYDETCYQAFVRHALTLKARGLRRYSARGILHVLRFETASRDGDDTFKINSMKSAGWARRAMSEHSELAGFFETRVRT